MEKYRITLNNRSYDVVVEVLESDLVEQKTSYTPPAAHPVTAARPVQSAKTAGDTGDKGIYSPLPGTVYDIKVKPGEKIATGQVVLVIEAMKMENEVIASRDGEVDKIHVSKGDAVNRRALLITLK
jgi:biotin carboxyl carrier protein